jgi:hypothetical protein
VEGVIKNEVVDLTKDGIDEDVKKYLALGPGFAENREKFPIEEYIAKTENVCQMLGREFSVNEINEEQKNNDQKILRKKTQEIMKKAIKKHHQSNLTKEESQGRKKAWESEDNIFMPADKGKIMVAMDKLESKGGENSYEGKMKKVLEDLKGKKQTRAGKPWDVTEKVSREGRKIIGVLVQREEITEEQGERLKPNHCHAPSLKGLCKVHKDGNPLRGVVSNIDSPFHEVSRFLVPLLRKLQGRSGLNVKNSRELKEKVSEWRMAPGDILVSFDVKNLYPSIPIKEALELIERLLRETDGWRVGHNLRVESVIELMKWIFDNTYCEYSSEFYKLDCGPIGLGVTGEVATIYMEDFQIRALETSDDPPESWFWYVDDSNAKMKGEGHAEEFLRHLNSIEEGVIEFTMELEQDGVLPVLDLKQERKEGEERLRFGVHYKKTHTNINIKKKSGHPQAVKKSIVQGYAERARSLCSEENLNQ